MDFSEKIVQYIITLLLVFSISVNEHFHVSAAPSHPHTACVPQTLLLNSHQIHINIIKEIYLLFYVR